MDRRHPLFSSRDPRRAGREAPDDETEKDTLMVVHHRIDDGPAAAKATSAATTSAALPKAASATSSVAAPKAASAASSLAAAAVPKAPQRRFLATAIPPGGSQHSAGAQVRPEGARPGPRRHYEAPVDFSALWEAHREVRPGPRMHRWISALCGALGLAKGGKVRPEEARGGSGGSQRSAGGT